MDDDGNYCVFGCDDYEYGCTCGAGGYGTESDSEDEYGAVSNNRRCEVNCGNCEKQQKMEAAQMSESESEDDYYNAWY